MADPKYQVAPVTVNFVDTSPAVSQSVPVSAANPLPVTLTSGATDQDVNLVGINGVAPSLNAGDVDAGTQRVVVPFNQAQITNWGHGTIGVAIPSVTQLVGFSGVGANTQAAAVNAALAQYVENGPYSYSRKTADGQVKATAGYIHTVSIAPTTSSPTAGLLSIYDSTIESGAVIYSEWVFATDLGHTIILDVTCSTGIFVGFDATLANVSVTVSYR